ncbi:MAG: hypothetical protein JNG88_17840 [Phycisphaerales bacterium]|nr:hypothetical protein [Phycisphaerales bacterium]
MSYRTITAFCLFTLIGTSVAHAQLIWRSDLPGTFIDIATNGGIPLNLDDEDETVINVSIGNFLFPAGPVAVGNNGGAAWAPPSTNLGPVNQPLPSLQAFGGGRSLLPFWDDIGNTVGDVWYRQDPNQLIIQWKGNHFGDSNDTTNFELQVKNLGPSLGPGNEIIAQLLYQDIQQPRADGGASATIGYQADAASPFVSNQFSFDTPDSVYDGTVLSLLVPEPAGIGLLAMGLLAIRRR